MKSMYLFAAIFMIIFAACNDDDKQASTNPLDYPAEVHGTIQNRSDNNSRTAGISWVSGDRIGVTTAAGISALSYVVTDDRNVPYIYNSEKDVFEVVNAEGEDNNIYFKGPYTMKMTAYYPYTGHKGTLAGVIEASTTSEKQIPEKQSAIDFLYAEGGGSQKNPKVDFQFSHRMCQLVLVFKAGEGVELNDIDYTLKGLKLDGTFNTADGEVLISQDAEVGNITMHTKKAAEMRSPLILFPQTLASASVLEVAMGGKTYAATPETDTKMESGHTYILNVTLTPQVMTIGPAVIEDWTIGEGNEHYGVAGEAK